MKTAIINYVLFATAFGWMGYLTIRCCNTKPVVSQPIVAQTTLSSTPKPTIAPSPTTVVVTTTEFNDKLLVEVNNPGACSFTDKTEFSLDKDYFITRFRTWYSWSAGEETVAYKMTKDGKEVASGNLVRKDCDPYQTQWCVAADFNFNKTLEKGDYVITLPNSRICQNRTSSNKGFVYVWGR